MKKLILASLFIISAAIAPIAASAAASDCASPAPNVLDVGGGKLRPAEGYVWVRPEMPGDLRVDWSPGRPHSAHARLVAGRQADTWAPAPGYRYANDRPGDFTTLWTVGMAHPAYPHVVAGATEGRWSAAPGWRFANDIAGDFTVVRSAPEESPADALLGATARIVGEAVVVETVKALLALAVGL